MKFGWKCWVCALAITVSGGCLLAVGQDAPAPQSSAPSSSNPTPEHPAAGARRTMEAQGELRWLSQNLNLTEEQKEKLRPIILDEGEQLRITRLDEHLPLDQKKAKMMEIRDSFRPKIAAVLTPEQQEKWKKMQEAGQQKHQEHPDQMKSAEPESAKPQ